MDNVWYNDFNKYFYEYYNTPFLNQHHFSSYEDFLNNKINEIISHDFFKIISSNNKLQLKISNIECITPEKFPNECRLNEINYSLKVFVTIDIELNGISIFTNPINNYELCEIPIQILSTRCTLYKKINEITKGKPDKNIIKDILYKYGECINELGGYFIIGGKEKVIVSQERLAYNKLYTHKDSTNKYILITEVKSTSRNSFIPARNTYVKLLHNKTKPKKFFKLEQNELSDILVKKDIPDDDSKDPEEDKIEGKEDEENEDNIFNKDDEIEEINSSLMNKSDNIIVVSFPGIEDIPLFIIFRALSYESDKQIYDFIFQDLLPSNSYNNNKIYNEFDNYNDVYNSFINYIEDTRLDSLPITDKISALDYIYKKMDISLKKNI